MGAAPRRGPASSAIHEDWLPTRRGHRAARAAARGGGRAGGWTGLYEISPDHNALIGEAEARAFLYATGFSGHGFLQAPAVGEILRDLYLEREPFVDVAPLSANRFVLGAERPENNVI